MEYYADIRRMYWLHMTDVDCQNKGNENIQVLYRMLLLGLKKYICINIFVYPQNISEKTQKEIATVLHLMGELSTEDRVERRTPFQQCSLLYNLLLFQVYVLPMKK